LSASLRRVLLPLCMLRAHGCKRWQV